MLQVHLVNAAPGEQGGREYAVVLNRFPCVVGRHSACDHRLPPHPSVSRRHCAFHLRDGHVWVEDLGSRNGTHLNGVRVIAPHFLADGDCLKLGRLVFRVQMSDGPVEATSPPLPAGGDVLVVEDDADAAETLALLLRTWGHKVRVASDGPQALRAAGERVPDAVLLDLGLPGMTGWEVADRLRAQAGLAKTRLVAVTGAEAVQGADQGGTGAFDRMLLKPVNADELRDALARPN